MTTATDPGPLHERLGISENAGRILGAVWLPRGNGPRARRGDGGRYREVHYRPTEEVRAQLGLAPDEFSVALIELLRLKLAATRGRGRDREVCAIEWKIIKREREGRPVRADRPKPIAAEILGDDAAMLLGLLCNGGPWIDPSDGLWVEDLRERAIGIDDLDRFDRAIGELVRRGLVSISAPSRKRGCGVVAPISRVIVRLLREVEELTA